MTDQQPHTIRNLIQDLLPPDHISLNKKRIRFINGEGVVLYDDTYAVEIYLPRNKRENPEFFGVHRHRGKIRELTSYFRKPRVLAYDSPHTTSIMKAQFEEAIFQFEPIDERRYSNVYEGKFVQNNLKESEIFIREHLGGAA